AWEHKPGAGGGEFLAILEATKFTLTLQLKPLGLEAYRRLLLIIVDFLAGAALQEK
ncbi:hypothetical protein BG000_004433, partial [Podila horticola]